MRKRIEQQKSAPVKTYVTVDRSVLTSQERTLRNMRKDLTKYYTGVAKIQELRASMLTADTKEEILQILKDIDAVARECQFGNSIYVNIQK